MTHEKSFKSVELKLFNDLQGILVKIRFAPHAYPVH